MQNRREHYRFVFPPDTFWKVTFQSADGAVTFSADVVNLSVGGICVKATEVPKAAQIGRWTISLPIAGAGAPLRVTAELVHPDGGTAGQWGFRFVRLPKALEQDRQERQIWKFILDQQRRERREPT